MYIWLHKNNTMRNVPISCLEDFISTIKVSLTECPQDHVRFYRGQHVNKQPIPCAFRNEKFMNNESEIFNEIVNKKPEEFAKCKCTFDYLVKMQHYGIPTRLLDITSNPLVALYFACSGETIDPSIYIFDIPKSSIKNYSSDTVTILSVLARYDEHSKQKLLSYIAEMDRLKDLIVNHIIERWEFILYIDKLSPYRKKKEEITNQAEAILHLITISKEYMAMPYQILDEYQYYKERIVNIITAVVHNLFFENLKEKDIKNTVKQKVDDEIWKIADNRLLHEIRQDKPYFKDSMHIETFSTIYCVKPRLENPRIIKQNGAFLIFPSNIAKLNNVVVDKIMINKNAVNDILNDLDMLDINNESLFNEMEIVCNSIKMRYQ